MLGSAGLVAILICQYVLLARMVWVDVTKSHYGNFYRNSINKSKVYLRATVPPNPFMDAIKAFRDSQGWCSHTSIKTGQLSSMGTVIVVVMED